MNAIATGTGLKRRRLDRTAEREPRTAAGMNATIRFATKRCARGPRRGRRARRELRAVLPHHREHRAGLDHDLEDLALLVVEVEQIGGEDQVAGARDGEELGEALDDAEHERLEEQCGVHAAGILPAGAALHIAPPWTSGGRSISTASAPTRGSGRSRRTRSRTRRSSLAAAVVWRCAAGAQPPHGRDGSLARGADRADRRRQLPLPHASPPSGRRGWIRARSPCTSMCSFGSSSCASRGSPGGGRSGVSACLRWRARR